MEGPDHAPRFLRPLSFAANPAATLGDDPINPNQPKATAITRVAVQGPGGIIGCFLEANNVKEAVKAAARQIAEDCGLHVDLELWTDPRTGPRRRLGELPFVAVDGPGNVVEIGCVRCRGAAFGSPDSPASRNRANGSPNNLAPDRGRRQGQALRAALTRRP